MQCPSTECGLELGPVLRPVMGQKFEMSIELPAWLQSPQTRRDSPAVAEVAPHRDCRAPSIWRLEVGQDFGHDVDDGPGTPDVRATSVDFFRYFHWNSIITISSLNA